MIASGFADGRSCLITSLPILERKELPSAGATPRIAIRKMGRDEEKLLVRWELETC